MFTTTDWRRRGGWRNKPETQKIVRQKFENKSPASSKQNKHISKSRFREKEGEAVDRVKIPSSYMPCKYNYTNVSVPFKSHSLKQS